MRRNGIGLLCWQSVNARGRVHVLESEEKATQMDAPRRATALMLLAVELHVRAQQVASNKPRHERQLSGQHTSCHDA